MKLPEKLELPKSVDNALENLTDKPTLEAGKTFADIWYLVFGGVSHAADKKRFKRQAQLAEYQAGLKKYNKQIEEKINAIPVENYIEPKVQIVAQALEDSKYCVEEPELREMFANLIASASDNTKAASTHPSFSAILKQMSPQDAATLIWLSNNNQMVPTAQIAMSKSAGGGYTLLTDDVIIPNPSDILNIVSPNSLSSLSAFGIIKIAYGEYLKLEERYNIFDQYAEASGLKLHAEQQQRQIKIKKGICGLTPYGKNFCKVCIS
jgi:hypothetical protein